MGILLWVIPLAALLLLALAKGKALHAISVASSAGLLLVAGFVTSAVLKNGTYSAAFLGGMFYLDSVSMLVLDIVVVLFLMTAVYSVGYLEAERAHGELTVERMKKFYLLMTGFLCTMVLALTVRNMGVMWIAIEATTLASAFLVGFHNDKSALEGAWKYVIICSVGIAVALLGIIFLHVCASQSLGEAKALDFTALLAGASSLSRPMLRFAFLFVLVGFGTKAGLAPMHTWLPDAHSQAPSPISALLSGVLLNTAMYGIIRVVPIVNKNLGDNKFTGGLLIACGLLSILTAALSILTQRDYKRLLAYSSIEHMGVLAFSLGIFTPAALFAGFFHMVNHSLTKSMLFLASGNVLQRYGTKEIGKIRGLLKTLPVTGTVFLLGLFAIGGMPPFNVFASELNVLSSAFAAGKTVVGALAVLLFAFVFAGIVYALFQIFYAPKESEAIAVQQGETNIAGAAVLVTLLLGVICLGVFLPNWLKTLLQNAANIIAGGAA